MKVPPNCGVRLLRHRSAVEVPGHFTLTNFAQSNETLSLAGTSAREPKFRFQDIQRGVLEILTPGEAALLENFDPMTWGGSTTAHLS
jgi:hypothetical protein